MWSREESQMLRHEFWHKLESKTRRLPGQNGKPIKWLFDHTGIKGLDLRFDVNRSYSMVAMEINPNINSEASELWQKMLNCKELFEKTYGVGDGSMNTPDQLVWDTEFRKEAGDVVFRIYCKTDGDMYQKEQWPNLIHFLINNMIRMEKAFLEVQDYLIHF